MRGIATIATVVALTSGCAAALENGVPRSGEPATAGEAPAAARETVPPGLGTLRQEDVTVSLRSGALLIKVTPLDEGVIRLLAPDTYQRLRALAGAHRANAERAASAPTLFLVSFFSHEPNTAFQSEDLQLSHMGRLLRPASVIPMSQGFGTQRLQQQETQLAVYVFDHAIDHDQPITVRYGFEQSDAWTSIIPRLEVERAKVRARTASGG
jgi:hypothetical protein